MKIIDILSEYPSLKLGFKFILENNNSNLAPYHNLSHILTVVNHCYNALEYMNMLDDKDVYVEAFLLSALFHDFNHSMGRRDDAFNIFEAKKGLELFIRTQSGNLINYLNFMNAVIDATQYPYILNEKELNSYQLIIRDADLMQITEADWITHVILGLSAEMHYPLNDLMVGERKFLRNIKLHTPYGKMMQETKGKKAWEDFKKLENLLL
jgi:hypothetical protein